MPARAGWFPTPMTLRRTATQPVAGGTGTGSRARHEPPMKGINRCRAGSAVELVRYPKQPCVAPGRPSGTSPGWREHMIDSTRSRLRIALPAAALLALLSTAACSGSSNSPPASPHTAAATSPQTRAPSAPGSVSSTPSTSVVSITIKNFAYTMTGSVKPGSRVKVTNQDSVTHTVTADSGGAFNVTVQPGTTATFTAPSKPGSYKFHCTFHANMHGTLTVRG